MLCITFRSSFLIVHFSHIFFSIDVVCFFLGDIEVCGNVWIISPDRFESETEKNHHHTDVSEFNLNMNLVFSRSTTSSIRLIFGNRFMVTNNEISPCRSRNIEPDLIERETRVSQIKFHVSIDSVGLVFDAVNSVGSER